MSKLSKERMEKIREAAQWDLDEGYPNEITELIAHIDELEAELSEARGKYNDLCEKAARVNKAILEEALNLKALLAERDRLKETR